MLLEVRPATPGDAASIAECLAELGYHTTAALVEQRIVEFAGNPADVAYVACRPETDVVGIASAHVLPLLHTTGNLVRLTALAVRRHAQGLGAGRMLVASVEHWAWAHGARRIEVTSGDHRLKAHGFYQAVGYVVDERRFIKPAPQQA